jgi:WD40 repeat protein
VCGTLISLVAFAQRPDLVVQGAHTDEVRSLAFSHDGKTLASGSYFGSVKLWDVRSRRELRTLKHNEGGVVLTAAVGNQRDMPGDVGKADSIRTMAFSPDDRILATAKLKIKLWNVAGGKEITTLPGHTISITSLAFSPDGRTLASGSNGDVKLWDVASGRELKTFDVGGFVNCLAFSTDGKRLAGGTEYHEMRLWDVPTLREVRSWTVAGSVNALRFLPDKRTLASSARYIEFWGAEDGRHRRSLSDDVSSNEHSVAFSPDGQILVTANYGSTITLWDTVHGQRLRTLTGNTDNVDSVSFTPDGKILASGSKDAALKLWDVATGHELTTLGVSAGEISSLAFSPDGDTLAVASSLPDVKLWDLAKGSVRSLSGHASAVLSVAFSPDGRLLASGGEDRTVKLWDVASWRELRTLSGHSDFVDALAFSPDGHTLASGSLDGTIKLWDPLAGTLLRTVEMDETGPIQAVAFSPDGSELAASGHFIKLVDAATGSRIQYWFSGEDLNASVVFSRDGKTLATTGGGGISLIDKDSRDSQQSITGHATNVSSVSLNPDGTQLASASRDGMIKLWNMVEKRELTSIQTHGGSLKALAYRPDGHLIASGGDNGITELWDADSGKEIVDLFAMGRESWVVIDPDGRFDTDNLDEIKGLGWVFPDEPMHALPPEVFVRDYFEPNLLHRALNHESVRDIPALSQLNRTQPEVAIVRVDPEREDGFVSVTVQLKNVVSEGQRDKGGKALESGMYDLRLFRDGQLVAASPQTPSETAVASTAPTFESSDRDEWHKTHRVQSDASGQAVITFRGVRLPQSDVKKVAFTAYAFNADRVKSQTTSPFEYQLPTVKNATPRQAYVITIGVNANQSPNLNLELAVSSAERARALVRDRLRAQYSNPVEIQLYSDLDEVSNQPRLKIATKANLRAALDVLSGRPVDPKTRNEIDPKHQLQAAKPGDAVVLYVASHGYADSRGTFYLLPYDTGSNWGITEDVLTRCQVKPDDSTSCKRAQDLLSHSVSSADLTAWWSGVDAHEMVMILDSCHSGAVPGADFRPGPLGDPGFGQLSYDKRMQILSASQPTQTAQGEWVSGGEGRTLLVDALEEAAGANPQPTLGQWLRKAEQQLPIIAKRLYPTLKEEQIQLPVLLDFARPVGEAMQ